MIFKKLMEMNFRNISQESFQNSRVNNNSLSKQFHKLKPPDQISSSFLLLNIKTYLVKAMHLEQSQNILSLVIIISFSFLFLFIKIEGDHCGYVYKTFNCKDLILNY